jgi:hypothetical protein
MWGMQGTNAITQKKKLLKTKRFFRYFQYMAANPKIRQDQHISKLYVE